MKQVVKFFEKNRTLYAAFMEFENRMIEMDREGIWKALRDMESGKQTVKIYSSF